MNTTVLSNPMCVKNIKSQEFIDKAVDVKNISM